jgi:hypothetical protein
MASGRANPTVDGRERPRRFSIVQDALRGRGEETAKSQRSAEAASADCAWQRSRFRNFINAVTQVVAATPGIFDTVVVRAINIFGRHVLCVPSGNENKAVSKSVHNRAPDPECTKSEPGACSIPAENASHRCILFAMMRTQAWDVLVPGARVATASDVSDADIGIINGNIAMQAPGLAPGKKEIDAAGRVVTSGGCDAHCHLARSMGSPVRMADGFESGARSAACCGATTVPAVTRLLIAVSGVVTWLPYRLRAG